MKTLITILGPGAAGKTTLRCALGRASPKELQSEFPIPAARGRLAKYLVYPNGVGVPGNLKIGPDDIRGPEVVVQVTEMLLRKKEVSTVVYDGVMCSRKWQVDWLSALPDKFAALYVYFDISPEENERRLLARRRANGIVETKLPEKTYSNMLAFRGRAKGVFLAAQQFYTKEPVDFLILNERLSPQQCANRVWKAVERLCK